jgi:DNA adenine methylase
VKRVAGVTIESKDACAVMRQHDAPTTLHYVDPPYVMATRSDEGADYAHEMDDAAHGAMLESLCGLTGMVVLSGYPHPLYEAALSHWHRVEKAALADGAKPRTEVLWINPHCAARLDAERAQLSLLDEAS